MKKIFVLMKSLIVVSLIIGLVHGFCGTFAEPNQGLTIHFLDVGQGDATIVLCDGEVMMIDGGDSKASQFIYAYLRDHLSIPHIDVMVATHPHVDHVGGLSAALNVCSVDVLYTSVIDYDTKTWQSVLKYAEAQGTPVVIPLPGDSFKLGSASVEILGPLWFHNDLNDMSLILKITYGDTAFLFMGDAEWEAEHDLLDANIDLSADLLRIGHHGSNSGTGYQFLRAVSPSYGNISVGKDNPYGHPAEEVLSRLHAAEVTVFRTDIHGTIICTSDGKALSIKQ